MRRLSLLVNGAVEIALFVLVFEYINSLYSASGTSVAATGLIELLNSAGKRKKAMQEFCEVCSLFIE